MATLKDIKKEICASAHFSSVVTEDNLTKSGGSKTVRLAKKTGLILAMNAGIDDHDIAKAFGYKDETAAYRAFGRAAKELGPNKNSPLQAPVHDLANSLNIDITNE